MSLKLQLSCFCFAFQKRGSASESSPIACSSCQLSDIDENLARSELTATQQAEHLAKRKELWLARNSVATCNTKVGRRKGFDTETAETTGVNRSTVNRAISRANGVTQAARDAIRGTELDKGVVLDC